MKTQLLKLLRARPFMPISLNLEGGKSFYIDSRNQVLTARNVLVIEDVETGDVDLIPYAQIVRARVRTEEVEGASSEKTRGLYRRGRIWWYRKSFNGKQHQITTEIGRAHV